MLKQLIWLAVMVGLLSVNVINAANDLDIGAFTLKFVLQDEMFYEYGTIPKPATRSFSQEEKNVIIDGTKYWTERVSAKMNNGGIIVSLAVDANSKSGIKSAYNWTPNTSRDNSDAWYYLVEKNLYDPQLPYRYHTEIVYVADYSTRNTRLLLNDDSITTTMTHELAHALGYGSGVGGGRDTKSKAELSLNAKSEWSNSIYDIYGNLAKVEFQNQDVDNINKNYVFALDESGGKRTSVEGENHLYVVGGGRSPFNYTNLAENTTIQTFFASYRAANVNALVGENGMPLLSAQADNDDDSKFAIIGGQALNHPALLGSIMSYSPLRNMLFTEVELAVIKDMGIAIDLKEFYGKSYYPVLGAFSEGGKNYDKQYTGLGGLLTADTKFTAANNGEYYAGYLAQEAITETNADDFGSATAPKTASYATGVHVYRDNLTLDQTGNIFVSGYGAGGMRVDGVNNQLNLSHNKIIASGEYATGVLVGYGRDNKLMLNNSEIRADNTGGIGAHFGILGGYFYSHYFRSSVGSKPEDIATLIDSDKRYFRTKINSDLNGALVNDFTIDNSILSGKLAAIKIENDAHVKNINVKGNSQINGDIISHWYNDDSIDTNRTLYKNGGTIADISTYVTALKFGDNNSNDKITFHGNIFAPSKTLNMTVNNGVLTHIGNNDIINGNGYSLLNSIEIKNGATLAASNVAYNLGGRTFIDTEDNINRVKNTGEILKYNDDFVPSGTFTAAANSILSPIINGASGTVISINAGTITFDSAAKIAVVGAGGQAGKTYNVLVLDAKSSIIKPTAANITLEKNSFLVNYTDPTWDTNNLFVTTSANTAAYQAAGELNGGVNREIANALSALAADSRLENIFLKLNQLTTAEAVNEAYSQLSNSRGATASAQMASNSTQQFNATTGQVFATTHSQNMARQSLGGVAHAENTTAQAGGRGYTAPQRQRITSPAYGATGGDNYQWNGFAKVYGGFGAQGNTPKTTGYDFGGVGALIGLDYQIADELTLGALFGYSYNQSRLYRDFGKARDDVLRAGFSGRYTWDNFYVNTSPTVGIHLLETQRNLPLFGVSAKGERTAFDVNWYNQAGYTFNLGNFMLTPSYSLAMTYLHDPRYTEKGAGVENLKIAANDSWSLTQNLELKLGRVFCVSEKLAILPEIFGGWEHEYLGANDVSMAFAVAPENSWNAPISRIAADRAVFGAGVTTIISNRYEIFGRYDQRIWDGGFNTNFTIGASVKF